MAIIFLREKRIKYLVSILLIILLLGILVIIWQVFLAKPISSPLIIVKAPTIEIDFKVLTDPLLEGLVPFEKIPAPEGTIGRGNPFVPYK